MNRRRARLVAVEECRRRYRAVTDDTRQLLAMAFTGLFVALGVLAGAVGAYAAGGAVAAGELPAPASSARPLGALLFLFVGFLVVFRELNRGGPPALDGHLTTVSSATLAAGYLGVEYAVTGLVYLPLAVLGAVAFGVGAGDPVLGMTVLFAAVALWVLAVPVWQLAVYGLQYAFARVPPLARHKTAIGVLAFTGYMGVAISGEFDAVLSPVIGVLAVTPAGWFSHVAFLTAGGDPALAAGALAAAVLGTPAAARLTFRAGDAVWHADPLPADDGAERVDASDAGVERHLPLSRPTATVVRRCWRRGWRAPITLIYVPYPVFFLVPLIADSIATGQVTAAMATLTVLYAPWAVGAAFTLNPLGDEGAVLPGTITTGVGGDRYVAGRVLAGVLPGTPLAALGALALGVASPLSATASLALAAVAVLLCPAAAAVAAGFGTAIPNAEASTVFRSREAVLPSPWAFLGYSIVLALAALPALAVWYPLTADLLGAGSGVRWGGTALTLLFGALAGSLGFRIASRAVANFEME